MNIKFDVKGSELAKADLIFLGSFSKKTNDKDKKSTATYQWEHKMLLETFKASKSFAGFTGDKGSSIQFTSTTGQTVVVLGGGDKDKLGTEGLRRLLAKAYKTFSSGPHKNLYLDLNSFHGVSELNNLVDLSLEALLLSDYSFEKYKSGTPKTRLSNVTIYVKDGKQATLDKHLAKKTVLGSSVNLARDFINEAPNVLDAVTYANLLAKDAKENLKNVKVKILNKAQITNEKMNLLLAVNAGSHHEPRFVHLSYTPKGATSKTKHYALVGKGITFDTGGYSLKPGASMMGMKFDMGGSATMYAAFRASVLLGSPYKLECILAITDNKIGPDGTVPDSIIKARSGKTVEILNTDAEGRLILADALDYACDLKPDAIIDAATLTGACIVSLGKQVAAVLGNNQPLIEKLLASAKESDEYLWQLPIIQEYRDDMKSQVADLKNIGTPGQAGTAQGAAFLEEFIKNDVAFAHLDIAGVCDSQSHLPYCPSTGASGLIIRTLVHLLNER